MQPTRLRDNEVLLCGTLKRGYNGRAHRWLRLPQPIRLFVVLSPLLLLCLCASCAELKPDAPSTSRCLVPLAQLESREEPPLQDQTVGDLLKENDAVREAFRLSETDKALTKKFILDRCKDSLSPSESSSQPAAAGAAVPK